MKHPKIYLQAKSTNFCNLGLVSQSSSPDEEKSFDETLVCVGEISIVVGQGSLSHLRRKIGNEKIRLNLEVSNRKRNVITDEGFMKC